MSKVSVLKRKKVIMRINKIFLLLSNIHSDTPHSCSKLSLILLLTHIIPTFALTHTFMVLITLIGESLSLVSVSRLKVPRLSVSCKILEVVSSRMKILQTVSSRSRLVCFNFTQSRPDLDE